MFPKSYWKQRSRNSYKRKPKQQRRQKPCNDKESQLLHERKRSTQLDSENVVKEVAALEGAEVEVSSHEDHLDQDRPLPVADDRHKDLLHVAMSIHMCPEEATVVVGGVTAADVPLHDPSPGLAPDHPDANLLETALFTADRGLPHASSGELSHLEGMGPRSQQWRELGSLALQGEDVPDHRQWNLAHHLLDPDAIDDADTHRVEAPPHAEIETKDDDADRGHLQMNHQGIDDEVVEGVTAEGTGALHHHLMTTEAKDVLT